MSSDSAHLFIEDDGRVLRFGLETSDVRIGRDQTNDIWIDNPAVRPQTCLVYFRDNAHNLKVFEGAKVLLNGQIVRGLNRLYSGDRIGVGDRELLYARDDSPAQIAVGLTILLNGEVRYGQVYRRTRVKLGRRDADLVLDDPSVADEQLVIECYSEHGLYAFDAGTVGGTSLNGKPIVERCRLNDGDVLQFGKVALRVHVLPVEAFGLLLAAALPERPLVPPTALKPMDLSPAQRHDPSAASPRSRQGDGRPVTGGFVRSTHDANAVAPAVPAVPLDRRPAALEPLAAPAAQHPPPAAKHAAPTSQHAAQASQQAAQASQQALQASQQPAATQIGSLQQLLRDAQLAGAGGEPQHTVMADSLHSQLGTGLGSPNPQQQPRDNWNSDQAPAQSSQPAAASRVDHGAARASTRAGAVAAAGNYQPRPPTPGAEQVLTLDEVQALGPPPLPARVDPMLTAGAQVRAGNAPVERPAVRIQVDREDQPTARPTPADRRQPAQPAPVQQQGQQNQPPQRRPVWQDESSQRENLRVRPREAVAEQQMVASSGSGQRSANSGFHELRTEMLDTQAIKDGAGGDWQSDPVLRRVFAESVMRAEGAPSTEVMEAYSPVAPAPTGSAYNDRDREVARDDDPRHRNHARDRAIQDEMRPPSRDDRYRLGRSTGGHEPPAQSRSDREVPRQNPSDGERSLPREYERDGRREDFRRSQSSEAQDPERYRLGRGEPPPRTTQDDRPRVKVRELSEAERVANPDYDQATDRPNDPQGPTDASQRHRQDRNIDGSRRGFDRDRDR